MPARLLQLDRRLARVRGVEDSPRRHPPPAVAVELGIFALVVKNVRHCSGISSSGGSSRSVDLGQHARRESQLVVLARQRERLGDLQRQESDRAGPLGNSYDSPRSDDGKEHPYAALIASKSS